jgi:hypothetical protein
MSFHAQVEKIKEAGDPFLHLWHYRSSLELHYFGITISIIQRQNPKQTMPPERL